MTAGAATVSSNCRASVGLDVNQFESKRGRKAVKSTRGDGGAAIRRNARDEVAPLPIPAGYIFWTTTFSDELCTDSKLTLVGSMVMPICQSVWPALSVRLRLS